MSSETTVRAQPSSSSPSSFAGKNLTSQSMTRAPSPYSLVTWVFGTERHLPGPLLRLTLALVMFPHGAQKVLGWFGGYGFEGTMGFLTGSIGLPWLLALTVVAIEFLGPFALLVGFATRFVAAGFVAVMLGAIVTVHASHGFFMNWTGGQSGEGFEYHLLVIGAALALVVAGGGRFALDRRIAALAP
jgi:putative oxidoreductase